MEFLSCENTVQQLHVTNRSIQNRKCFVFGVIGAI